MNYINHLQSAYERFGEDEKLKPRHISVYMALFQLWNMHRFVNPFYLSRNETMKLSRIGSVNTYVRTLNELDQWGYIGYHPSKSPLKGSTVTIITFDTSSDTCTDKRTDASNCAEAKEVLSPKRDHATSSDALPVESRDRSKDEITEKNRQENNSPKPASHAKGNKRSKRSPSFNVPDLEEVEQFFKSASSDPLEAKRFFNYFESNGWKVGGRTPMKNWKAAARNWMLNASKYAGGSPSAKVEQDHLFTHKDTNYGEPL